MNKSASIENYLATDLWIASILSISLILITVLFHYEALRIFTNLLARPSNLPRIRILQLVFGLFLLHTLEILIFAVAYQALHTLGLGELRGLDNHQLFSYFYYSAVVYNHIGLRRYYSAGSTQNPDRYGRFDRTWIYHMVCVFHIFGDAALLVKR
jgi:hypothetical protein